MKKIALLFIIASSVLFACRQSKDDNAKLLSDKKTTLDKLMVQKNKIEEDIKKLQAEIDQLDSTHSSDNKAKLVATSLVATQKFEHFIDLRGKIDAENISYITPRGMGGQVKSIFVKEGDVVHKGQLLLKLDDAIVRHSLAAARQQLETIKTQLSFSNNIYNRQNALWQKGIGTEVQLISAKTNMETLQNQLRSAEEQVKVVAEQLNTANVYSDVDGIAETVMVKVGELFGGMGQIKIVNNSHLKATANVPETYINSVHKGSPVVIEIPELNKVIRSNISLIGQTIENTQRGFVAEAKLPNQSSLKPNLSVVMKILDYAAAKAIVIPVNTLQTDEQNKYVYVLEKLKNGKSVATRKLVIPGQVSGDLVEIKSGLSGGEQLITVGYQNLYEGQAIKTN